MLLDESAALVFLVSYDLGGDTWAVRLKQEQTGDKAKLEVIEAVGSRSPRKTAAEWEDFVALHHKTEDFWAVAIHEFLRIAGAGEIGQA